MEQRKPAHGENHVMDSGGDGTDRQPPFEAEHDVDQNPRQRAQRGQPALFDQLLAHLRPDELGSRQRGTRAALGILQGAQHLIAQGGGVTLVVRRDADQHILGSAEMLRLGIAETGLGQGFAHHGDLHRFRVLHFDHRTAGEVQSQIHAPDQQGAERDQQHGDGPAHR